MVAQVLHRRDRRAGARLRAQPQPGRRPALDHRRRQARAERARLHRPRNRVLEAAHQTPDQGHAARAGAARRADVGPASSRPRPIPTATISSATACRSCAAKWSCSRDEGVSIIQIDDPHLCLFVDPEVRRQYDDADRAADFAVDMDNAVVDGVDGIKMAVHLCRRAGARARGESRPPGRLRPDPQPARPPQGRSHHDGVHRPRAPATWRSSSGSPSTSRSASAASVANPAKSTPPETIVAARGEGAEHVDPERITLNPDCGFAPGSAAEGQPRRGLHETQERGGGGASGCARSTAEGMVVPRINAAGVAFQSRGSPSLRLKSRRRTA